MDATAVNLRLRWCWLLSSDVPEGKCLNGDDGSTIGCSLATVMHGVGKSALEAGNVLSTMAAQMSSLRRSDAFVAA